MSVWAIADLHLSFSVPSKTMEAFGPPWVGYLEKLEKHWKNLIAPNDLVLIAGDISWAMRAEEARPDLDWIHQLPGTKLFLKGNHDFWWESLSKVSKVLPSSIHLIQNNAFFWEQGQVGVAGARLWDTPEYNFKDYIDYRPNTQEKKLTPSSGTLEVIDTTADAEKIFIRDLGRLEMSLKCLNPKSTLRIAMTHYPPIDAHLTPSRTSAILEKYHVDICVFGHLHNIRKDKPLFGVRNGVHYYLTACDYLDFTPMLLLK